MKVRYLHFPKDPLACQVFAVRGGYIVRRNTDGAKLFPADGICEDKAETEEAALAIRSGLIEELKP
jgi:hypothetical protein